MASIMTISLIITEFVTHTIADFKHVCDRFQHKNNTIMCCSTKLTKNISDYNRIYDTYYWHFIRRFWIIYHHKITHSIMTISQIITELPVLNTFVTVCKHKNNIIFCYSTKLTENISDYNRIYATYHGHFIRCFLNNLPSQK